MDFWHRARSFAEEAAKRSQELTLEAAKKSQDHIATIGSSSATAKLSGIVSEAARKSKEIAAEASKQADQIRAEALKRADLIRSQIPASASAALSSLVVSDASLEGAAASLEEGNLERFGVTEELRDFVKGITLNTFRDFPSEDDADISDIHAVSNVRQDLTAWQEKHAKLVLLTVKEISKLRYELCPRVMKERKFWRIYFILVNSHVSPYEKRYMEEAKQNAAQQVEDEKMKETSTGGTPSKTAAAGMDQKSKTSSATEQDLDVFLLGDLGDSDDAPEEGGDGLDDDFD